MPDPASDARIATYQPWWAARADLLARRQHDVADHRRVLMPVVIVLAGIALLIMAEPDLTSLMVITVMVGTMLVIGGVRFRHLATVAGGVLLMVTTFSLMVPWRRARILSYFGGAKDSTDTGYQVTQSLLALTRGGWTGVGLGAGRAKWRFLPAAHTDFIFPMVGEEFGLVGTTIVLGLFCLLIIGGLIIAHRAEDRFGKLLAFGIVFMLGLEAIMNMAVTTAMLPNKGLPLPFVSYGGSSLVAAMAGIGILLNIHHQTPATGSDRRHSSRYQFAGAV